MLSEINSICHISSTAQEFWVEKITCGLSWLDETKSLIYCIISIITPLWTLEGQTCIQQSPTDNY